VLAFVIGIVMGLVFAVLGAGGGIIAVPVLLMLFALPMSSATAGALAVVWAAAMTAAFGHARGRRVDWRVALAFGLPSMVGAMGGARLNALSPERLTTGLFALVLVVATLAMFRKKPENPKAAALPVVLAAGLGIGVLTGYLGVGGGFLIVPALVTLAQVPLHRAVGTSTAIIAGSSFAGAVTTMVRDPALVSLVLPIAGGAMVGALVGAPLAGKLPEKPLRLGFAALAFSIAATMAWRAATM
jgi:uncharacterized membrane protein YfcA